MKPRKLLSYIAFFCFFAISGASFGQSENSDDIRLAIKSGSARGLSNFFNDPVELKIDGKEGSYSKSQAEFVMKDFFKKNPSTSFQYNHHGESPGGSRYSIGTYKCSNSTYRVYMKLKKVRSGSRDTYMIDTLDFSKE